MPDNKASSPLYSSAHIQNTNNNNVPSFSFVSLRIKAIRTIISKIIFYTWFRNDNFYPKLLLSKDTDDSKGLKETILEKVIDLKQIVKWIREPKEVG